MSTKYPVPVVYRLYSHTSPIPSKLITAFWFIWIQYLFSEKKCIKFSFHTWIHCHCWAIIMTSHLCRDKAFRWMAGCVDRKRLLRWFFYHMAREIRFQLKINTPASGYYVIWALHYSQLNWNLPHAHYSWQ